MIYVTVTDTFMSGWGMADGKINKLVFECETEEDAQIVMDNLKNRSEMTNISKRYTIPTYGGKYYTEFKDKNDYPNFYKEGFFHE